MSIFVDDAKLDQIISLLQNQTANKSYGEDILLQYPSAPEEMLIPGGVTVTTVNRRINRMLRTITVSIPTLGVMTVENNNITRLFFSGESGTLEFPKGIYLEDVVIKLTNTGTEPARFNYRMIFSE